MMGLPDPHRSRSVLIGTARYEHLSGLPSVKNNLQGLAVAITAEGTWGLPEHHVSLVTDPNTAAEMLDPIHQAADAATDTLLLYYAGHGLTDQRGELHLGLVGSDCDRIYTAVSYDHVRDIMVQSRAARRVVILDCCFSGRALGTMADPIKHVVDEASAEGTYVLTATAENNAALAPPGDTYTAFTAELIDVLEKGIHDCGELLDLDSIYLHIRSVMRGKGLPVPQKRDRNTSGRLTLFYNHAHHRPKSRTANGCAGSRRIDTRTGTGSSSESDPVRAFNEAMVNVYKRARQEAGYNATYFLKMISEIGGYDTARQLLHSPGVSAGFTALWERKRLDLSVEAVVLERRFADLFSDEEREIARARLEEYGYTPDMGERDQRSSMKTSFIEEHDYDPRYHSSGTRAAAGGCSWHGRTCEREVVASVLTGDQGGTAWHAVCEPALDALRRTKS